MDLMCTTSTIQTFSNHSPTDRPPTHPSSTAPVIPLLERRNTQRTLVPCRICNAPHKRAPNAASRPRRCSKFNQSQSPEGRGEYWKQRGPDVAGMTMPVEGACSSALGLSDDAHLFPTISVRGQGHDLV